MRYPAKVFAPFQRFRKVAVFGTGKARVIPVVLLDQPDGIYWETWMKFLTQRLLRFGFISKEIFLFFKIAHNVQEPVREILQFYKIDDSTRWVGKKLVIRISHPLSKKGIADLNERFSGMLRTGEIVQAVALRQEKNEPEIWDLPRLFLLLTEEALGASVS